MDQLAAFLLAGLALTGSPGPANLSLAALGGAYGARRSLPFQAGAVLGMLLIMALTGSGVAALLLALPGVRGAALVLGAGYLLWLAWRLASAPVGPAAVGRLRPPSLIGGCLMQLANPKAYGAMAALFSGYRLRPDAPAADLLWKAALLLGLILAVTTLWLHLGGLLRRLAARPRRQRAINVAFALLLLASALPALPL